MWVSAETQPPYGSSAAAQQPPGSASRRTRERSGVEDQFQCPEGWPGFQTAAECRNVDDRFQTYGLMEGRDCHDFLPHEGRGSHLDLSGRFTTGSALSTTGRGASPRARPGPSKVRAAPHSESRGIRLQLTRRSFPNGSPGSDLLG